MGEEGRTEPALDEEALASIGAAAAMIDVPVPGEPKLDPATAAEALDVLFPLVAKRLGALDIAIGDGLSLLRDGGKECRLGYSGIGDYARERLGIGARRALDMARLATALRVRPLLRQAVHAGEIGAAKAEKILGLAVGDAEASWVERAKRETVRSLAAAAGETPAEDERIRRIEANLGREEVRELEEAIEAAGVIEGAATPRHVRVDCMSMEFLADHPPEDEFRSDLYSRPTASGRSTLGRAGSETSPRGVSRRLAELLERETLAWAFLDRLAPVPAPDVAESTLSLFDAKALHRELLLLARMRAAWDSLLGHLALLAVRYRIWQTAGFASFEQYCVERLGMSLRAVQQRVALERRLHDLPALRAALSSGRIDYEQARLVSFVADLRTVGEWIERAAGCTRIQLRREIEAGEKAQMSGTGIVRLRVPESSYDLLQAAFSAVRRHAGRYLTDAACLLTLARHFLAEHGHEARRLLAQRGRVGRRDRGLCQVPGCSRAGTHQHHIVFRSAQGGDEDENLVCVCPTHHLRGIHAGYVTVTGRAPDRLVWVLGADAA